MYNRVVEYPLRVNVKLFLSYFHLYHHHINNFQREIKSYKYFQSSSQL